MKKILFMIATSFFWFSMYAYVPELSTYAKELGGSYGMIGLITGAYGLTQTLLRIPLGILSDKLNKRKGFIELGMLLTVISALITFFFPNTFSLLVTRLLAGVAASTWVLFTVLFASYYRQEEAPKAIGIMNGYNSAGQLVSMILGGLISWLFGTRYLYLLGAIGGAVGFVLSLFIDENTKINRKPLQIKDILRIAMNPRLLKVSILAILSQVLAFGATFGFVPIIAQRLGASHMQLSLITAISIVPAIGVSVLSGTLFVRLWGESKTIIYGFLLNAGLCILTPFVPSLGLLMIVQFFVGVGQSMVFSLLMGLSIQKVEEEKRATAMGFFQAVYGIGMVMGPIILGALANQYGLTTGFVVTGMIGLMGVILTMKFKLNEQM